MMTRFYVRWSKSVKISSIILGLIISLTEIMLFFLAFRSMEWGIIVLATFIMIVFLVAIIQTPLCITISSNQLIINRIIGKVKINIKDIIEILPYKREKFEVKIFGSGGLFGYIGIFRNEKIGNYQSYVGNYQEAVLIVTTNKKYLISCEDRDKLISDIKIKQHSI